MEKEKQLSKEMEKMKNNIYEIVIGAIDDEKIESIFQEGCTGDALYDDIYHAKLRLNQRLGLEGKEDRDIELIINNMFEIGRLIGYKMFDCGYMLEKE